MRGRSRRSPGVHTFQVLAGNSRGARRPKNQYHSAIPAIDRWHAFFAVPGRSLAEQVSETGTSSTSPSMRKAKYRLEKRTGSLLVCEGCVERPNPSSWDCGRHRGWYRRSAVAGPMKWVQGRRAVLGELSCVRTREHGRGLWWLTSEVAAHRSSHPQSQLGRRVRAEEHSFLARGELCCAPAAASCPGRRAAECL